MPYAYQTFLGVEPYAANGVAVGAAFGGGAQLNNKNLIITLWDVTALDFSTPTAGALIKPFLNTAAGAAAMAASDAQGFFQRKGFGTCFDSRYAARIYLDDNAQTPTLGAHAMAVMQPPQDLKNDMQLWARTKRGTSGALFGIDVTLERSYWYNQAWDFKSTSLIYLPNTETAIFGGGLGGVGFDLPFCKTSGADGVFPTFFDNVTPAGQLEMFETLADGGDFFVPCVFTRTGPTPKIFTFSYPYSAGRR